MFSGIPVQQFPGLPDIHPTGARLADGGFVTPNGGTDTIDGRGGWNTLVYNFASTAANIQHNADGSWLIFGTGFTDTITNVQAAQFADKTVYLTPVFNASIIQAENFAITRTTLLLDQATSIASSINSGAQTEAQFINNLLSQVADTGALCRSKPWTGRHQSPV
jgi:hypothetical protein